MYNVLLQVLLPKFYSQKTNSKELFVYCQAVVATFATNIIINSEFGIVRLDKINLKKLIMYSSEQLNLKLELSYTVIFVKCSDNSEPSSFGVIK